jgi:hypothetical protein
MGETNLYYVLSVPSWSSQVEIKNAYRYVILQCFLYLKESAMSLSKAVDSISSQHDLLPSETPSNTVILLPEFLKWCKKDNFGRTYKVREQQ